MNSRIGLTPILVLAAAAAASADDLVLLRDGTYLDTFDAADPAGAVKSVTIKGLEQTTRIYAIDTRPSNGVLYGLGLRGLFRLDPATGWATNVGGALDWMTYFTSDASLEFDPATDVARVFIPDVVKAGAHPKTNGMLRVDPDTGRTLDLETLFQPAIVYAAGDRSFGSRLLSVAFAESAGSTTTLFGIDRERGTLIRIGSGDGVATTIGELGIPSATAFGLEIAGDGVAYAMASDAHGAPPKIYRVDLTTGAATEIRKLLVVSGDDIAMAPTASTPALRELDVAKAVVRLDFTAGRRGTVELRGTLPAPWPGKLVSDVRVSIAEIGAGTSQIYRRFLLNRRGRGRFGWGRLDVFPRSKRGGVRYSMKITHGDFPELLIDSTSPSGPLSATVDFLVDGVPLRTTVYLDYVAKGDRGVATMAQ